MAGCDPQQMSYQFNWLLREHEENKTFDYVVIDMVHFCLTLVAIHSESNQQRF